VESKFDILLHHSSNSVHLKLTGDFDGNSAHRLINLINQLGRHALTIFVHTNALGRVVPDGSDEFRRHLPRLKGKALHIVFTGESATQLSAPSGLEPKNALHSQEGRG
jgi:hypothetical protein